MLAPIICLELLNEIGHTCVVEMAIVLFSRCGALNALLGKTGPFGGRSVS